MRRVSLSLRGKLLLGFVLPTGLAIAGAVVVYRGLAVSVATAERVNLTNQVIAFANVAIRAAVEAEASERGYVVTGGTRHLDRYNEALRTFDKVARKLAAQLPAGSEQGHRLERAKGHLASWVADVAAPAIGTRRSAPAGLAATASRLMLGVLQLRPLADAAATGDAAALASWARKVTEVRSGVEAGLALGPGDLMSWIRIATLLSQHEAAMRGGSRTQRDRLAEMETLTGQILRATEEAEAAVSVYMRNRPGQVTLDPFLASMGALVDQENADLEVFRRDSEAAILSGKVVALAGPGLAAALAVILGVAVSVRIVRSVRSVSRAAQALAGGRLDQRVPVTNDDEIGVLARTFNLMADRLAARDREMALLGQLGDLLAACSRLDEAYAVIARIMTGLLPEDAGALYLVTASKGFERVVSWGPGADRLATGFGWDNCWAVRRGHEHRVSALGAIEGGVRCGHAAGAADADELCIPLMAQGEVLALLGFRLTVIAAGESAIATGQLSAGPSPSSSSMSLQVVSTAGSFSGKAGLAAAASEPVAMALANLRLREKLQNESIRDPLTGLFNRRFLEEAFVKELSRARREKRPVGVMILDVDHFKRFNDSFGHAAGDALLTAVGKLLGGSFRQEDIACRFGGEEFVVVLPGASLEDTARRAEQLRQATAALALVHQGTPLGAVTASIGVAAFPGHGETGKALLEVADACLYRAKKEGRDRVVIASAPAAGEAPPLKAV